MLQREEAKTWIYGYTATAMGLVLAGAGIPGTGTAACVGIEVTMCYHIGEIYGYPMTWSIARDHAFKIGLATVLGKVAILEALTITGPLAYITKPAIAGPIVASIGEVVISYYENK